MSYSPQEIYSKVEYFVFECLGGVSHVTDIDKARNINKSLSKIKLGLEFIDYPNNTDIIYIGFSRIKNPIQAIKEFIQLNATAIQDKV